MRVRSSAAILVMGLTLVCALVARAASPGTNPFTEAVTRFPPDTGKLESIKARGELPSDYLPGTIMYFFCWPPGDSETNTTASGSLTVAPDGTLTGTCQATRESATAAGVTSTVVKQGSLTGTYDLATQKVSFELHGSSTYTIFSPPACEACEASTIVAENQVTVVGPVTGGDVVGDRATGTARFTFSCGGTAGACPVISSVGTIDFLFQFLPALPSAEPAPGGGGTGGAGTVDPIDGVDLPTALVFLLLLALAMLVLAVIRRGSFSGLRGMQGAAAALEATLVESGPATPSQPDADARAKIEAEVDAGTTMALIEELTVGAAGAADPPAPVDVAPTGSPAATTPADPTRAWVFGMPPPSVSGAVPPTPAGGPTEAQIKEGGIELLESVPTGSGSRGGDAAPPAAAAAPTGSAADPTPPSPPPATPVDSDVDPEELMAEAVGDVPGLKAAWESPPSGPDASAGAISGAMGSDRSGGHQGLSYGEGAQTAAPADPKAYEALVVAQSQQANADEPLVNANETREQAEERERERQSQAEREGR
jgi:hypothetical protein